MGTEVEGKAYIRGYFDMAHSSVNSNGNVLLYYEEKKPSLHLSDKFTIISANGSVHYDKEMLKWTMLVHEATFRKQVYELHRLYKIQKDLMAEFQREESNGYARYADTLQSRSCASQAPGDVKGVGQTGTPISGHDVKLASIDSMNETSSQYSVKGDSLRHSNVRSRKKVLDLQLPADVYADHDDDVQILDEKPLKSLPGNNSSVHGGNTNLNLGNSISKHVGRSWTNDVQPQHNSAVHTLNKPAKESSNMKITDFLGVGISTSQNRHHLSQGVNLNLLGLQGNSREKCVGKISDSSFFGANEEIRHCNSFIQRKDDPSTRMAWLQHNQNGTASSLGHYLSSASSFNHLVLAPPLFNGPLNSLWQSNNTSYLTKSHYGCSVGSTSNTPYHHPLKIHGEPQYWKPPPCQHYLKDLNLNDEPADTTSTWQQGSENSLVDVSMFREKPVNLMKSEVPSSCANGHSQTLVSSTLDSKDINLTRIPGFPISAVTEKDSQCSPTLQCDINIAPSNEKCEADMEMQPRSKNVDTRNLFDLNEALPIMDDPEGDIEPHESGDPSRAPLSITAAENLLAIRNDTAQTESPQLDTLHWFAELATSKNTMSDNDSDDDFEALTLKLEDTKSYEYHSTPRSQVDNCKDGHSSTASLLITRPRRGKARGRPKKKKDFQRDILPALASLPEHEVSGDLLAIGRSKTVTPAKRGGRKGQQPRGGRRVRSVSVTVEEAEVSSPPDALLITRWGRTTRRCRRSSCPPANNASLRVA